MANKLYEETDIQNIANAIREKAGTTDTFKVSEMANAISNIKTNNGNTLISSKCFDIQFKSEVDYIDVSKLTWYQGNKYGNEGDSIDNFITDSTPEIRIYSELFPITRGLILNNSDKKIGINLFDANKICIKSAISYDYDFYNGTDLTSLIGDDNKKLAYMYFQMVNSDDTTPISPSDVPSNLVII